MAFVHYFTYIPLYLVTCAVVVVIIRDSYYYTVRLDHVKVLKSRWNFVKTETTTPGNNIYTLLITFIALLHLFHLSFKLYFSHTNSHITPQVGHITLEGPVIFPGLSYRQIYRKFTNVVLGVLVHLTPLTFFSRILRSEERSFSLQIISSSEEPFYGNYSTLDSHTNTVISHAFAYSSRWRRKPWQGLLATCCTWTWSSALQ